MRSISDASQLRKRKLSGDSSSTSASECRKKKLDGDDAEDAIKKPKLDLDFEEGANRLIQAIPTDVLEANKRKLKTGFKLFHLANLSRAKERLAKKGDESDAESSDKQDRLISNMWNALTQLERRFYQDRLAKLMAGPSEEATPDESVNGESDESITLGSEDEALMTASRDEESSVASSARSKSSSSLSAAARGGLPNINNSEMIGQWRRENCCVICEEIKSVLVPEDVLRRCRGVCQRSFHVQCLPEEERRPQQPQGGRPGLPNEEWRCNECATGQCLDN
jgi:hypothetical protein